ncbi:MAG: UDP-N-acetylmuramate--L-alanine ligase [Microbacteriaceae bacterium]|jgi:UDP-N-acetylmuramate--alanine ligase|nr:UDP-N-acetylmuramate--L-alanine ligase [Microbacteriaceae bacterium]MCI1207400.1 UDP-N-acetylmuramate--L-alanine ligase [Microbacteriaceae bacterium]
MNIDFQLEIPEHLGTVHFIGIGGSGMNGIASMIAARGVPVQGSDRSESPVTEHLQAEGIRTFLGQRAENLGAADTVVVSSAIPESNPELQEARRRGLLVLHRSQALAWLARGHRSVAVAGAHGKTTSTGMLVTGLQKLGGSPSFVDGDVIRELGTNWGVGDSDVFIFEADESDGSFLVYRPWAELITNLDADHLDHYGDREHIEEAFVQFTGHAAGPVIINGDNAMCQAVLPRMPHTVPFGKGEDLPARILSFDQPELVCQYRGERASAELVLPGRHNARNALGAAVTLTELGFSFPEALQAVASYRGTHRRFDLVGEAGGVRVYDDYAHHPTEVAAVLQAAHSVIRPGGRILAVHQPHLFSRTRDHADEFAEVFSKHTDFTVVLDVFAAREDPIPGIDAAWVASRFPDPSQVRAISDWTEAASVVAQRAQPGDIVLTLGGGDVYRIAPMILAALHTRFGE